MSRLFARPESPRCFRTNFEELEVRAQPALLTFAVSVPVLWGIEARANLFAPAAVVGNGVSFQAQSNESVRITLTFNFRTVNLPTTPPTNPPTTDPTPAPTPAPTQPPANAPGPSPSPVENSGAPAPAIVFLPGGTSAAPSIASSSAALAPVSAGAPILLPPDVTTVAVDVIAAAALAPEAPTFPEAPTGGPTFAIPTPFLYLRELSGPRDLDLFGGEGTRPTVFDGAGPRAGAPPSREAIPSGGTEAVAEVAPVLSDVFALVVAESRAAEAPAVEVKPPAEASEGAVSPWVWASTVAGVVAGASWVLHRHGRKPTPPQPEREWRTYLLGLDFDRM